MLVLPGWQKRTRMWTACSFYGRYGDDICPIHKIRPLLLSSIACRKVKSLCLFWSLTRELCGKGEDELGRYLDVLDKNIYVCYWNYSFYIDLTGLCLQDMPSSLSWCFYIESCMFLISRNGRWHNAFSFF